MVSPACVSGPNSLKEWLWIILIVIGVIFLIIAALYTIQIVFGYDFEQCVDQFDYATCDIMFPPIPLQSVNWTVIPFP